MQRIYYDIIYLAACGVNGMQPYDEFIREPKRDEGKMEMLYRMSRAHFLDALVGTVLKEADITLPKKWTERISKAVRKNLLFDVERKNRFTTLKCTVPYMVQTMTGNGKNITRM